MPLLQHSVSADRPLAGYQLTNPILKGTVRVLHATALPDCLNEKVLAQLAPIYRRFDQTIKSISVNVPKIGLGDLLDDINVIQNSVQNVFNAIALDVQTVPKKRISCDANIPRNVQQEVDKLLGQVIELERVLSTVDLVLSSMVADNVIATSAQRILIIDIILDQFIPVRLIGIRLKCSTINNCACALLPGFCFSGNCCRYCRCCGQRSIKQMILFCPNNSIAIFFNCICSIQLIKMCIDILDILTGIRFLTNISIPIFYFEFLRHRNSLFMSNHVKRIIKSSFATHYQRS